MLVGETTTIFISVFFRKKNQRKLRYKIWKMLPGVFTVSLNNSIWDMKWHFLSNWVGGFGFEGGDGVETLEFWEISYFIFIE